MNTMNTDTKWRFTGMNFEPVDDFTSLPIRKDYDEKHKDGLVLTLVDNYGIYDKKKPKKATVDFGMMLEQAGLGKNAELGNGNARAIVEEAIAAIQNRYMEETVTVSDLLVLVPSVISFVTFAEKAGIKSYTDFYRYGSANEPANESAYESANEPANESAYEPPCETANKSAHERDFSSNMMKRNGYVLNLNLSDMESGQACFIYGSTDKPESEAMISYRQHVKEYAEHETYDL